MDTISIIIGVVLVVMPNRTEAYLAGDEKGHIQASSLEGTNKRDNIVPQARDLNHGAYYAMERG